MRMDPCPKPIAVLLLTLLLGGAAVGCDDDEPTPRPEIEGLIIQQSQTVIVEVRPDGVSEGLLTVEEGQTSDVFFIVFTDGEGFPVELEDEEFVILRGFDETIVDVRQASPGSQGFQLIGIQGGQTGLVVELARGDPADPDAATAVYVTPDPVGVAVTGLT